ncbi:tRNA (adenosine(37)-N6)-dimethylallyltransferase MiaA [Demequina sp. TTPB684]|uniref:tRNA (adenosine(37)-N6)-dimethylallyltransferase MiaA n=1 Tax=unclassified Demequina TaxID=2620311 RepID=UPI001CF30F38|nr:tRNA (adenosine(37)-N6)-dimethylallyltransferase MiaA [Demequina sp. TMPB413]MCB2413736.1 tRNA (adenosine(37)-N6)-dimethylallyltransferase MiaA [Demequina sp. TTPB684]UPU89593.1 tRNA (adenosine(37)-N6)-dimethylallyltransferase MiaA [Demequina sp. TMPB413]
MTRPIVAIVGATATGKSAVSLELAHLLGTRAGLPGAEIINADSMQFYRGMDIGTAKLPVSERRGVTHHQLDTLDVTEDASVARFQESARADVAAIHARDLRAIVVGGSGLYLRALLDRFDFPGTDPDVRARLEARAEAEGPGILHRELAAVDAAAAAKIHPRNAKRIVRALEIIEVAGDYASSLPRHEYAAPAVQIALELPYAALDERIDARVERMWADGLVDEVRKLVDAGLREGVTARRAVGYAETLAHLDGEFDAEQARELIARNTRRLARKQDRWFRPDPRVKWVAAPVDAADVPRAARDALTLVEAASVER